MITNAQQLASFIHKSQYRDLSEKACEQLKIRILDSLGTAIGAVEVAPVRMLHAHTELYSSRFPNEMPSRLQVHMSDNRVLEIEKKDYEGFHTRAMSWQTVFQKFEKLAGPYTDHDLRRMIFDTVRQFENHSLRDLTALLAQVKVPEV